MRVRDDAMSTRTHARGRSYRPDDDEVAIFSLIASALYSGRVVRVPGRWCRRAHTRGGRSGAIARATRSARRNTPASAQQTLPTAMQAAVATMMTIGAYRRAFTTRRGCVRPVAASGGASSCCRYRPRASNRARARPSRYRRAAAVRQRPNRRSLRLRCPTGRCTRPRRHTKTHSGPDRQRM